jgi:hypothetical protein
MEFLIVILILFLGFNVLGWYSAGHELKQRKWFTDKLLRLYKLEKERHYGFVRRIYQEKVHEMLEEYEMDLSNYQGEDTIPMENMEEKLTDFLMAEIEQIKSSKKT